MITSNSNPTAMSFYFCLNFTVGVFVHSISEVFNPWRKEPEETRGLVEKTTILTALRKERRGEMLTNKDRILLNKLTRQREVDALSASLFLYLKRKEKQEVEARKKIEQQTNSDSGYLTSTENPEQEDNADIEWKVSSFQPDAPPLFTDHFSYKEETEPNVNFKKTRRSKRKKKSKFAKIEPIPPLVEESEVELFIDEVLSYDGFSNLGEETEETEELNPASWISWLGRNIKAEDDELEEL